MYLGHRNDKLPIKFTAEERRAYVWLRDCGIDGWFVDLKTKRIRTPEKEYASLVDFRKAVKEEAKKGGA